RVTYRTAGRSLDALFRLKDNIMGSLGMLKNRGVGVESVGVQDGSNKVMVGVSTPTAVAQTVLESLFGKGNLQAFPWKLTNESDRYNDSPPWNGGDQIVSEGTSFTSCTTGFGLHDACTGAHNVTIPGHWRC